MKNTKSYSDAGQDLFALEMNTDVSFGWAVGVFVDIGCSDCYVKNNTALLEENGWTGIGIDNSNGYEAGWNENRPNSVFVCADATTLDYKELFEEHNLPSLIHYVSLDIDPTTGTLEVLKRLPFDDYKFRAITFETNLYLKDQEGSSESPHVDEVKEEAKKFMASKGYTLYKEDVEFAEGKPFEDWYIYDV